MKNQIKAKYGVAGKDLDLNQTEMRAMAAKLIWQNYRQALDKEFIVRIWLFLDIIKPFTKRGNTMGAKNALFSACSHGLLKFGLNILIIYLGQNFSTFFAYRFQKKIYF